MDKLKVTANFRVSPQEVYDAWLDGDEHGDMTGANATGEAKVGSKFTAWDGYISGTNLELEPHTRIVQAWRTTEFPADAPDSRLEIELTETPKGCKLMIVHTNIPAGQGDSYKQGWKDHYFEPMKEYFVG